MDDGQSVVTRRQRRGAVSLLLAMVLLGVFPLDVLLPSFPALAEHFRRTPADIALSISLFAVGIAFAQLLIGPLSDVIGRKGLLLAGMSVSIFGALGCVMTSDYSLFLIFRVVQALGCGCFVLSQALVQDLFEGEQRDRLRILMVTAGGIFISISPLAGTFLQATLGWRGSFWVFIALSAAVLLKAWLFLENTRPIASGTRTNFLTAYRQVLGDFDFVGYWLISAFAFACHFSFIVISPLIFMDRLQLSAYEFSLILLIYGAAYVTGGILASVLSRRINSGQQMVVGLSLILFAGVTLVYLSSSFALAPATVLIPMLICTAGTTIARPAATSRAMSLFPENAGTSASAGSTIIFICGGLISALISLSPTNLQSTLGYSFVILSGVALALNARISRRNDLVGQPDSD
ncbi:MULTISPECIES: multidrug effflux MFS transporter [Pseudomonas]|uniref:multidrug effflux MFS transporter n=1 Tax=Pseudomonas TaxID=286 RepID=UPI0008764ECC|nr:MULTISPECIES: multidrug effflux MFS transporter [Pseudomonas]TFA82828.1 DHA1 family bicyclomycin/chloramphenicol resistance-like MFS transporter [Pseudomonas sp. LAIL14HWK12:I2]SCZ36689.1 MFS transporter, DHA1 family, bicyclomycin/chloramphenicol resistance protein [Pseudomonas sp. NFIX46]SDB42527.1 MFS transporter, DHA1 family, bicyclomycin/chloramphenicol resistance protein [Pseudomonas putida]SFQ89486.1 MFS transporter, DHA1 family, bicyclomycin/chloramphenicol resistance protein [Pseudom